MPTDVDSRRAGNRTAAAHPPAFADLDRNLTEETPAAAERKKRPRRRSRKSSRPATDDAIRPDDEATDSGEAAPAAEDEPAERSVGGFGDLALSEEMFAALRDAGYSDPTPVQAGVIPEALAGKDVLGQARTGTGKTAAFAIPILEKQIIPRPQKPQALVLVPTRELAVQVRDEFVKLGAKRGLRSIAVYGGKPIRAQVNELQRGPHVVVGTPGRVIDHVGRGALLLDDLKTVVLDEADRMLDIGFRPDIEKILRRCPTERQTLLLSATVPPAVEKLSQRYMVDPVSLDFSPGDVAVESIEQHYFSVAGEKKFELLLRLLKREQPRQAIVFCRTKRGVDKIYQRLSRRVKSSGCIHGDLAQGMRDRVMRAFRDRKVRVLIATDVVGRGIDVSGISHIVNYDVPVFCDDYVHRVGRTGRMGREGVAYTFITPEEGAELTRIEMRINKLLKRDQIEGFDAVVHPAGKPPPLAPGSAEGGDPAPPADGDAPAEPPKRSPNSRRKRHRRAL